MVVDCVQLPYSSAHPAQTLFSIEECYLYKLIIRLSVPTNCRKWLTADFGSVAAIYFLMLIDLIQQTDKLLFDGMAGGKFVTMACNCRNTIGFSLWNDCHWQSSYFDSLRDAPHTVSLPYTNRFLTHWRGSAQGSLV